MADYKSWDKNGDGKVVVDEVMAWAKTQVPTTVAAADADKEIENVRMHFKMVDGDDDGFISEKEFGEAKYRISFRMYDKNNDGTITYAEMKEMMNTMVTPGSAPPSETMIKGSLAQMDKDGDSKVTFEDYLKFMKEMEKTQGSHCSPLPNVRTTYAGRCN